MVMTEAILITGSTGFIGQRLVRTLINDGCKVRVFLRRESQQGVLHETIDVVRGSFTEAESLAQAVRGVDRIIHLAGVTKSLTEGGYDEGNVMPVKNILEAVTLHNPQLKRFLYVSSLTAGGPASEGVNGVTEQETAHPVSAYGRSKLKAEAVCMEYAAHIPVTIVRPPAVYGPGDKDVLQVFQMLAKGLLVSPVDVEKQRFSMIYVDDLVAGVLIASRSDCSVGKLFYITSLCSSSWDDVIEAAKPQLGFKNLLTIALPRSLLFFVGIVSGAVAGFLGKPALINRDKVNELVQHYWVCSPVLAQQKLGFTARTTLADGVAATIAWYREKGWL